MTKERWKQIADYLATGDPLKDIKCDEAELLEYIAELQWDLNICHRCGGTIHHHLDEPFYSCSSCGVFGESTKIPKLQEAIRLTNKIHETKHGHQT